MKKLLYVSPSINILQMMKQDVLQASVYGDDNVTQWNDEWFTDGGAINE